MTTLHDKHFRVTWLGQGRKAECAPDSAYPRGMVLDLARGHATSCAVALPYPAPCVGLWAVLCQRCGFTCVVTAAGRPDDPHTAKVPCNRPEARQQ